MKAKIIARKFTVDDKTRDYVAKKFAKLDKFFSPETEASVTLYGRKGEERVELTIFHGGTIFRAEVTDKDYQPAIVKAVDIIERQIRKNRTRLEKKLHIPKEQLPAGEIPEEEEPIVISKVKRFDIVPMTVEEAIMQMNLLSHEFYLFRNVDTGAMNLVYKRKENDYGVIEPVE